MSALTELFPEITNGVCRSYLQQARATPNDVSAQIKAVVLSREQLDLAAKANAAQLAGFHGFAGAVVEMVKGSLRTKGYFP